MPVTIQAALLGIVQGLTEFLPVSSSAHLILARVFFGFDADKFGLPFAVALHVGTLVAVVVCFWRDIAFMSASLPQLFRPGRARTGPAEAGSHMSDGVNRHDIRRGEFGRSGARQGDGARLIWLLAIGTIPAVAVGVLFGDAIETHLQTPQVAAVTLVLGALAFFVVERYGEHTRDDESLTMAEAFWIGCAQALALVPGVSRSGATITVGLLLGLRRYEAARFAFLLGVPAILGAAAKELPRLLDSGLSGDATLFVVGIATSAVVGYLSIRFFIRYLGSHSLDVFGWYRIALSAVVVIWIWRA